MEWQQIKMKTISVFGSVKVLEKKKLLDVSCTFCKVFHWECYLVFCENSFGKIYDVTKKKCFVSTTINFDHIHFHVNKIHCNFLHQFARDEPICNLWLKVICSRIKKKKKDNKQSYCQSNRIKQETLCHIFFFALTKCY